MSTKEPINACENYAIFQQKNQFAIKKLSYLNNYYKVFKLFPTHSVLILQNILNNIKYHTLKGNN